MQFNQVLLGDYRETLRNVEASLIFTSPPYNIGSKSPRRDGQRKNGKYDPKSYGAVTGYPDALPEDEYQAQQAEFMLWCADHLTNDGVLVYNHKPRRRNGVMIHPAQWFLRDDVQRRLCLMEEVVWDRGSTHNHSNRLMWPQTERLYVFRKADGTYPLLNDGSLPYRSDLWRIALNSRAASSIGHNVPFDLELAEAVISAWSKPGGVVCDPYSGSGTTGVAAVRLGRQFVGSERVRAYWVAANRRLETVQ